MQIQDMKDRANQSSTLTAQMERDGVFRQIGRKNLAYHRELDKICRQALIDGIFSILEQHKKPVFGFELDTLVWEPFFPETLKDVARLSVNDFPLYRAADVLFGTLKHYDAEGVLSESFLNNIRDPEGPLLTFLKECSVDLGYVLFKGDYTEEWYMLIKIPSHRRHKVIRTLPLVLPSMTEPPSTESCSDFLGEI